MTRWQLRQQKYSSNEAWLEHRKVNKDVRKKMKAAKEEWIEEQCHNIEKKRWKETARRPVTP